MAVKRQSYTAKLREKQREQKAHAELEVHLAARRAPEPSAPPRPGAPDWVRRAADRAEAQQKARKGRGAGHPHA